MAPTGPKGLKRHIGHHTFAHRLQPDSSQPLGYLSYFQIREADAILRQFCIPPYRLGMQK